MVEPLVEIKLMRIYKLFQVREKQSAAGQVLIDVKNFGRVYGEVTKKIHFILTSVARDGRSDFSIISMYQTGRCRYFYSQDKDGLEIKTYLERLFAEESDIFIGVSPEDDFLNILSFEGKKEVLSEKVRLKNVAHVKNGLVKESSAINSLETLLSLEEGK